MKELNHRFGFYLVSVLMIVMLVFLYLEVRGLSQDVDVILNSAQSDVGLDPLFIAQMEAAKKQRAEAELESEEVEADSEVEVEENEPVDEVENEGVDVDGTINL